ncbi:hypothetical protein GMORB2_6507 [Geosmithia morbida]|uniref:Uncharacterized protein n=1 Tax=Geosmithia morbida TaxID=1094350 RepID=A0A9P5D5Y1_9HYPO|nr:uncharacterized protein GMORB2_6507 [Geosmithia morbida]KAF4122959.1 hypothetical protein GMORB2_6507 [Geosmithia morbida]
MTRVTVCRSGRVAGVTGSRLSGILESWESPSFTQKPSWSLADSHRPVPCRVEKSSVSDEMVCLDMMRDGYFVPLKDPAYWTRCHHHWRSLRTPRLFWLAGEEVGETARWRSVWELLVFSHGYVPAAGWCFQNPLHSSHSSVLQSHFDPPRVVALGEDLEHHARRLPSRGLILLEDNRHASPRSDLLDGWDPTVARFVPAAAGQDVADDFAGDS